MRGRARLRQVNAILGAAIFVCFCIHAVAGSFLMLQVDAIPPTIVSHLLLTLCVIHIIIGIILTVDTVRASRQKGHFYGRLNTRFWVSRISGFSIALLIICHLAQFVVPNYEGAPRLNTFGPLSLAMSLALLLSVAIHVVSNVEALSISLGLPTKRGIVWDVALAFSLVVLFMAVAFIIYFVSWSVM